MTQQDKERIEKDAREYGGFQYERVMGYIAGAIAEHDRKTQSLIKALDGVLEEQLKQERNKAIDEGIDYIKKFPLKDPVSILESLKSK